MFYGQEKNTPKNYLSVQEKKREKRTKRRELRENPEEKSEEKSDRPTEPYCDNGRAIANRKEKRNTVGKLNGLKRPYILSLKLVSRVPI